MSIQNTKVLVTQSMDRDRQPEHQTVLNIKLNGAEFMTIKENTDDVHAVAQQALAQIDELKKNVADQFVYMKLLDHAPVPQPAPTPIVLDAPFNYWNIRPTWPGRFIGQSYTLKELNGGGPSLGDIPVAYEMQRIEGNVVLGEMQAKRLADTVFTLAAHRIESNKQIGTLAEANKASLVENNRTIKDLEALVKQLRGQLDAIHKTYQTEAIKDLKITIEDLRNTIKKLEVESNDLRVDHEQCKGTLDALYKEFDAKIEERNVLADQNSNLCQQNAALRSSLTAANNAYDDVTKELADVKRNEKRYQDASAQLGLELQAARVDNTKLQTEVADLKAKLSVESPVPKFKIGDFVMITVGVYNQSYGTIVQVDRIENSKNANFYQVELPSQSALLAYTEGQIMLAGVKKWTKIPDNIPLAASNIRRLDEFYWSYDV